RYALLDRLEAALETARGLRTRLARSRPASGRYSRDLLARLAGRLWVLHDGLADFRSSAPIEVAVYIEPAMDAAGDRAAAREWCTRLAEMYRSWAASRNMQLHDDGRADLFVVSG